MGGSARRVGCLCLLALGVVGLSPASAGAAVTLGSHHMDPAQSEFSAGCPVSASCVFVQKRLPGGQVRAPFSGEVRTWRVVSDGPHDYQLVVMRKKGNGKYKNVGESSVGSTPGAGEFEFSASLSIHEGDYVGLLGEAVQGVDNAQAKILAFDPALRFPDARRPSGSDTDELQFNATMRH